jgi:hypothetical protein
MNKIERFNQISHRIFAVVLIFGFWWVPLGLHRLWMGRRYWWAHTVAALSVWWLSLKMFRAPENANFFHALAEAQLHGRVMMFSPGDLAWGWPFFFVSVLWLVVFVYDFVMIFYGWPVPEKSWKIDVAKQNQ